MSEPTSLSTLILASCVAAVAAAGCAPAGATDPSPATTGPLPSWSEVDRLVSEQKLAEAGKRVEAIEAAARAAGDDRELARALVRSTQLGVALGGYESAVEALRARAWPESPLSRAAVTLYDAFALDRYLDAYGWEIGRREHVVSGEKLDLELWTRDQIAAEIDRDFARVWALREPLGAGAASDFEFLHPNDYPDAIRPTLRDAVAYLWADRLADSSGWSPAEAQELWKLDLDALVAGSAAEPTVERLSDADLHPLAKLSSVLADLERWHRARKESGAALEARLVRLESLHAAFETAEDRVRIRSALAGSLAEFRGDAWWGMGMARLAALWRESPEADALLRARSIAVEGERAYPGSPGARACRREREEMEAPSYSLQAMTIDAPARRSLEVDHRNLTRLHFRAFRLPDAPFASRPVEWAGWNEERIRPVMRQPPVAAWSVELPTTADLRDHRTFVTPPLDGRGRFLVVASAAPGFGARGNQLQAVELRLSDLVVVREWDTRQSGARFGIRALSGASGQPLAGARASLFSWQWQHLPELVAETRTDADGWAEFGAPGDARRGGGFAVVVRAERTGRDGGEEAVWSQPYWPWNAQRPPESTTGTLVFTDRAIYRPGQKLLWKTITYEGRAAAGSLHAAAGRALGVKLLDPNGEEVASAAATTDRFGSASGELEIPAGRLLGAWTLTTDAEGQASIAVEEYKRPTFEVTLAAPASEARLNRPVELIGEARYYFGLPVTSGRVAWRVVREPMIEWSWRRFWAPPAPPRTVANGSATPDAEGKFHVRFTPEADERDGAECGCFRFSVEAEVTDDGGETRSGSRSLALGRVAVRLSLPSEAFLLTPESPHQWTVRREDLDGEPRPGASSWRIVELTQPAGAVLPADLPERIDPARERFSTPGDRQRPRWAAAPSSEETLAGWSERRDVARGELSHDPSGAAQLLLPALAPGAYRLAVETKDAHGDVARLESSFVVVAREASLALPLELRFEQAIVPVGGTAHLFVHSALPGQTILVEITRGEALRQRRTLVAGRDPEWIELPVGAADRGGFGARALVVRDHQVVQRQAAVAVPWDDKGLTVELSTFRDRLEPGRSESWRVTVKGADGKPLGAEGAQLVASMYDRSLDLFRDHNVPLVSSIYPSFGAPGALEHELGATSTVWTEGSDWWHLTEVPSYRADTFVEVDPYGIGGPGGGRPRMMMKGVLVQSAMPAVAAQEAAADRITIAAEVAPRLALGPSPPTPSPVALRTNFSETAFWMPHLITDAKGGAAIEFRVPDALTSWKVWVSAWTRDLASGYLEREARTVKELMVRPYLPRFLREGDAAEIKVVVDNSSDAKLAGELRLAIEDPDTHADRSADFGLAPNALTRAFTVDPAKGQDFTFPVTTPRGVRPVAFRVEARAGARSDGERRELPVLPSRILLAQSRFAAIRNGERRELTFDDMKRPDPTRIDEQLVVTIDGQLFFGMLDALPYLVDYPYECTEQTLNRFVSTAILGSFFDRYPAVGAMAKQLAARETKWETFDAADPNRRMALEETPWLREARGGDPDAGPDEALLRVLDPAVARAVRAEALAKLAKAQLPSGAFPWFPGGPPSPHMTLYLLAGFARAAEFGAEMPRDLVARGWQYLAGEIDRDWWRQAIANDCCWEMLTFANYVASSYPDPAVKGDVLPLARRRELLDFSFEHWKQHAPESKLQLALTLRRLGRPKDARLVLDAVMDSAKSDRDLGTYWAPEDRAWLWYNDTIETHAWALRALSEIAPADPRREGLVQWLFLNKKLGHWKSTRATAEVLYSLAHYLEQEKLLGAREELAVTVGGRTTPFVFEPDRFTGKRNQLVLRGAEIVPTRDATTVIEPKTRGFAFASATWQFSTEQLPAESRGDLFAVERRWFRRVKQGQETTLLPLAEGERLAVGDELEIQLSIRARAAAEYVHLRDPRPAGLEPDRADSGWQWDLGLTYYEETRDSGTNFFFEALPAGEYTLKYRLRANLAGTFRAAPAELESMYAPEFVAYSAGAKLTIAP
jgi:uncharacterized protein YfaS (alpha-2-macroglobulin family)